MKRRRFLKAALTASLADLIPDRWAQASGAAWTKTWNAALDTLQANVKLVPQFDQPVLFEGSVYKGTWMECGPHESLANADVGDPTRTVEGKLAPMDVAINTHRVFFRLQRADGQFPASVKLNGISWGQIQMVVPIAATAGETAQRSKNEAFLSEAYQACSRWDAWLRRYRNTRGTGLVEAFCTYDTGRTTARAGKASRTHARMTMRRNALPVNQCRACAPISPLRPSAPASHSAQWRRRWANM